MITAVNFRSDGSPTKAVDGDYNGFPPSNYFHTSVATLKPWLTIDLGDIFNVQTIAVLQIEKTQGS